MILVFPIECLGIIPIVVHTPAVKIAKKKVYWRVTSTVQLIHYAILIALTFPNSYTPFKDGIAKAKHDKA